MRDTAFSILPLNEALLTNLASLGYVTMTPIQAQSLPLMLNGDDVIAKANTGSGKTAAFGLTILNQINVKFFAAQALVLCPTRELAEQVSQALRQLARQIPHVKIINLSGGMPLRPQLDSLNHGAHIVVGTPGRVQKHLDRASLDLTHVRLLVLDEADRMLDMGFLDAIRAIIKTCPRKRQTLLFSATYPLEMKALSSEFMQHPKEVVADCAPVVQDIEQRFYEVTSAHRFSALIAVLKQQKPSSALIFCNTKQQTADVCHQLNQAGFHAMALNGDLEQEERDLAVIQFINQSCTLLVATDVAARGLDIKELPLVINYELAFEPEVHTHRIGRTGRAGNKGIAISLTTPADAHRLCALEEAQGASLIWGTLDEFSSSEGSIPTAVMVTLCLDAGKKDKLRAGDILGALTKDAGLPSEAIGKIDVLPLKSYVAIHKTHVAAASRHFQVGKLKGRRVNARRLSPR